MVQNIGLRVAKTQLALTPEDKAIVYGSRPLNLTRIAMVGYDQLDHDHWTVLTVMVVAARALAEMMAEIELQSAKRVNAVH